MLVIWLDKLCLKLTFKLDVPLDEGRVVLEVTRSKRRTNETAGLVKLRPHSVEPFRKYFSHSFFLIGILMTNNKIEKKFFCISFTFFC